MAMTSPVTSSIALRLIRRFSPMAIRRSTFSTTAMASSTTMPTASTRPKSERLLRKSEHAHDHERADECHRNGDHGDGGGAPSSARNYQHHDKDENERLNERMEDAGNGLLNEHGGVVNDAVVDAGGESGI